MVIHQCVHCKKEFDYPWMLKRHYERKYKCIVEPPIKQIVSNGTLNDNKVSKSIKTNIVYENNVSKNTQQQDKVPNCTSEVSKCTSEVSNCTSEVSKCTKSNKVSEYTPEVLKGNQCNYCKKIFQRKQECKKHLNICKMKNDPIRQLEIKANVEFVPPPPNTCRFCKASFTQSHNLSKHLKTCKEIDIYKEQLQLKVQQITNNTNCHNTTNNDYSTNIHNTNNITINAIGSERIDHIALEKITQMLIKQGKEFVEESVYLISGNVVIEYQKMLREIPENRNLIIPSWRSPRALIKTPGNDGFIKMEIGEALDTSFRNTAKILFEKINEIKELRGGFSNEQTHEMQNLVKFLGSHGIKFAPFGQTHNRNEVKRRYKAANMESVNEL